MTPNRLRSRLPALALCPRCALSMVPCRMLPGLEPPHRHPKADDPLRPCRTLRPARRMTSASRGPCPLLDDLPRPIVAVIQDGTLRCWRGVRVRWSASGRVTGNSPPTPGRSSRPARRPAKGAAVLPMRLCRVSTETHGATTPGARYSRASRLHLAGRKPAN